MAIKKITEKRNVKLTMATNLILKSGKPREQKKKKNYAYQKH